MPLPADPIDLLTVAEYKIAKGIAASDTTKDDRYQQAITAASRSILNFTDRDFKPTPADLNATSEKSFVYDITGVLEIPDARAVTVVKLDDTTLAADDYLAQPYGEPILTWIELIGRRASPQMGFMRNADTIIRKTPAIVKVTAKWGWDAVPADVKQAAVWTIASFEENPDAIVTSKSIDTYSISYANPLVDAIPKRALDILENYTRVQL